MTETPSQPTKKCPYCSEQILVEAMKCRFCGEWLAKPAPASVESSAIQQRYSHAQPAWHVLLLSLLTDGLYVFYWFYRNWKQLRQHKHSVTSPGWGTVGMLVPVLQVFLTYRQFRDIRRFATAASSPTSFSPGWQAFGFSLIWTISAAVGLYSIKFPTPSTESGLLMLGSSVVFIPAILLLMSIQKTLNTSWLCVEPELPERKKFTGGETAILIIGGILTTLIYVGGFV